jgi:hypothetical protein
MGVIPKKTTPLTKFVRTGEGVLVFAFNLTMLIVPIVSNALSPEDAVKWAGIVNGVAVISRTGLKVVAEVSKATGIEPQPIGNLSGQVVTADTGGSPIDGDASGVVTGPTEPVVTGPTEPVVTGPTEPVVTGPTEPVVVTGPTDPVVDDPGSGGPGEPSDDEEFASTPTADDDAVDVPAPPVPFAGGATADDDAVDAPAPQTPSSAQATDSPDPLVSDEEEFSSVPPPGEDDDDSVDVSALNDEGAGELEPAAVAVPADPVITDGGGGHLS